jgi:hypothetical protein
VIVLINVLINKFNMETTCKQAIERLAKIIEMAKDKKNGNDATLGSAIRIYVRKLDNEGKKN